MYILLTLAACHTEHPIEAPLCGRVAEPLALDEVSRLGFSADELVAQLTTQQSRWEVAWTEPADVGVQTFEVDVVGVESASLVRYEASHEDAAYGCPDDHLEVALQVDITSTDGEVASSGPAELLATALGDPTANLSFAHEATFGPVVLAHLEGEVPAGATVTGTHFRAGYGHIEIGVSWDGPESIGWDRVYHCTWEGFRQEVVTDCMTMTTP